MHFAQSVTLGALGLREALSHDHGGKDAVARGAAMKP